MAQFFGSMMEFFIIMCGVCVCIILLAAYQREQDPENSVLVGSASLRYLFVFSLLAFICKGLG